MGERADRGEGSWSPSGCQTFVHYLIARRDAANSRLLYTFFHLGEEVLPVFCSGEAAKRFLFSRELGDGWYVRKFSAEELISLLFIAYERVAWILPNPLPGHMLSEDALSHLISQDEFIGFLVAH